MYLSPEGFVCGPGSVCKESLGHDVDCQWFEGIACRYVKVWVKI